MREMKTKKLGIIGGVGPAATSLLFERIVDYTDVRTDQNHLDIVILNYPARIPDRTAYLLDKDAPSFVSPLQEIARELEELGCEVIALPCNTAHARFAEIEKALDHAHLIHMPREVATVAQEAGVSKCGLLATDGTVYSRVYSDALAACGIEVVLPDERHQKLAMDAIYLTLKAGDTLSDEERYALIEPFIAASCDGVVLGCTEFSLMGAPPCYGDARIIDALDVLAQTAVKDCGAPLRITDPFIGCRK